MVWRWPAATTISDGRYAAGKGGEEIRYEREDLGRGKGCSDTFKRTNGQLSPVGSNNNGRPRLSLILVSFGIWGIFGPDECVGLDGHEPN